MESRIFWFVATVACVLAFGFAFRLRRSIANRGKTSTPDLAKGQEKDNWLTCLAVWGVILAARTEFGPQLQLLGAIVVGWTAWRTLRRLVLIS